MNYFGIRCSRILITSALIAVAIAAPVGAQGIKKETLTEDPAVVESLEPSPTTEGNRSPKVLDADTKRSEKSLALDEKKRSADERRSTEKKAR